MFLSINLSLREYKKKCLLKKLTINFCYGIMINFNWIL
ncbi:putative hypothetical protein [Clostridium botulinum BKT015925]|nr:putative hypothetical protein [Clostridium botulinum BKT015925]